MITVNLRPGQRRKRSGQNPLKGLLDGLSVFREISAKVKDPLLMGAVGAWVVGVQSLTRLARWASPGHATPRQRTGDARARSRARVP
jgi:hypothetical protein